MGMRSTNWFLAEDMEILPKIGLGPLRFGMTPSQVQAVLGSHRTYEAWMGGNLNDSLLYPGLIIGFDECDGSGPLPDSKLVEFRMQGRTDVTFLNKPIFGMPLNELLQTLAQPNIGGEPGSSYVLLPDLNMEVGLGDQDWVESVEFWR